ncbi:MAG: helix-turn-helix domain-containing protein [Gammaproteobacteria bacterium]|jgi:transcriptional regulator with XRE-family HTH domain
MARPNLQSFKKKALSRNDVREQYDELAPAYELRKKLVSLRHNAGLTQEQIAEILHTNKSNISRLESVDSTISPKLSTIADYAEAIGYKVKIDFIPKNQKEHNKALNRDVQKSRTR